jgi:hypothetical protein
LLYRSLQGQWGLPNHHSCDDWIRPVVSWDRFLEIEKRTQFIDGSKTQTRELFTIDEGLMIEEAISQRTRHHQSTHYEPTNTRRHHYRGGYISCQGRTRSNAPLAARTSVSANRPPTSWSPTGRPPRVSPAGIDAAG